MDANEMKKLVGFATIDQEFAAGHLRSGVAEHPFRVGLGTGTTAIWAIRRLAELVGQGKIKHIVCVPTSLGSQLEGQKLGLRVSDLNDPVVKGKVDWAFDGADQVSPEGYLVKGGGAAHAREKLVEYQAGRFVVLVDERKMVPLLGGDPAAKPGEKPGACQCDNQPGWDGNAYAVPVEVMPMAMTSVIMALESFGAKARAREANGKIGPVVSDNGLYIVDAVFPEGLCVGTASDPVALEMAIKMLPGVLDVGLFTCPVAAVYIGKADGRVERRHIV
jgi:ribose 5-phosphate isomerase A